LSNNPRKSRTRELRFIFIFCPSASWLRCRAIRTNGLKIFFPQVSNRLVTGSCENDLDLAGERRRLAPIADCDPVDRCRLLCATRHYPVSRFDHAHSRIPQGAVLELTCVSRNLSVLRGSPHGIQQQVLASACGAKKRTWPNRLAAPLSAFRQPTPHPNREFWL
jgi:hypothetical protein